MGTFNIIPDGSNVTGGDFTEWTAFQVGGADLIAGLLNPTGSFTGSDYPFVAQGINAPPPPFVVNSADNILRLSFSLIGNIISLDGAPAISFAGLPSGFQIDSATIQIWTESVGSDPTTHFRLQWASMGQESGDLGYGLVSYGYPGSYPPNLVNWWNNGIGIRADNTVLGEQTSRAIARLTIGGTWSIAYQVTSITPNPGLTNEAPFQMEVNGTDLDQLPTNDWELQWTDADGVLHTVAVPEIYITYVSTILIYFLLWEDLVTDEMRNFSGTVTLFSGVNSLGTFTVLYATGSGLYRFVADKRNDTLYDRETDSTTDVAIPEPFGETGFIGG